MENNQPKPKREIVLIVVVLALITAVSFVFIKRPKNQESVIPIPSDGTGAILSSPDPVENESYTELYNLMEKGEITTDSFKIVPIYQERRLNIILKDPELESKAKAEKWLKDNGFGHLPAGKITFTKP